MSTKKTYEVAANLTHDGNDYAPGDSIDLADEHAAPLLRVGTLHPLGDDGAAPAPPAPTEPAEPAPTDGGDGDDPGRPLTKAAEKAAKAAKAGR